MNERRTVVSPLRMPAQSTDRIDLSSHWELTYWATQWGVSPEQIVKAVASVGTNLRLVRRECAAVRSLRI
ncbi:DUF3606 domain-containing protein [Tahibacter sp. UC22_41]|uniref:DUF3606 domain-containing protein n=1 Tax=Tahibacter sp. UC22_41 TaxID=3350178 RepID=UPI002B8166A9|nr:DUF3606 domain-containing protein [Tahibacter sp.]